MTTREAPTSTQVMALPSTYGVTYGGQTLSNTDLNETMSQLQALNIDSYATEQQQQQPHGVILFEEF